MAKLSSTDVFGNLNVTGTISIPTVTTDGVLTIGTPTIRGTGETVVAIGPHGTGGEPQIELSDTADSGVINYKDSTGMRFYVNGGTAFALGQLIAPDLATTFYNDVTIDKAGNPVLNIDSITDNDGRIRWRENSVQTSQVWHDASEDQFKISMGGTPTDAFAIDSSGHVVQIGQDTPSTSDYLQWDGSKAVWAAISGGLGGSGSIGYIPIWVTDTTTLGNSIMSATSSRVTINGPQLLVGDNALETCYIGFNSEANDAYIGVAHAAGQLVTTSYINDLVISARGAGGITISADSSYASTHLYIAETGKVTTGTDFEVNGDMIFGGANTDLEGFLGIENVNLQEIICTFMYAATPSNWTVDAYGTYTSSGSFTGSKLIYEVPLPTVKDNRYLNIEYVDPMLMDADSYAYATGVVVYGLNPTSRTTLASSTSNCNSPGESWWFENCHCGYYDTVRIAVEYDCDATGEIDTNGCKVRYWYGLIDGSP